MDFADDVYTVRFYTARRKRSPVSEQYESEGKCTFGTFAPLNPRSGLVPVEEEECDASSVTWSS